MRTKCRLKVHKTVEFSPLPKGGTEKLKKGASREVWGGIRERVHDLRREHQPPGPARERTQRKYRSSAPLRPPRLIYPSVEHRNSNSKHKPEKAWLRQRLRHLSASDDVDALRKSTLRTVPLAVEKTRRHKLRE